MRTLVVALALLALGRLAWAEDPPKEAAPASEIQKAVDEFLRKTGLTFYGHFKLDMSRDSAETNFGDTAIFVRNYGSGDKDDEVNITARHTRFGLNWDGGEFERIHARGNLEIDFLGKSLQKTTETEALQSAVRLRHTYMVFDFAGGWSLLAGQTWDVFGKPNMSKLNTCVGWGQGNIGFRRPQLRVEKEVAAGEKSAVTLAFAITRAVAVDTEWDDDATDDGEDAGVPDFQAHVGFSGPLLTDRAASLGIGGFYGWREVGGGSRLSDDESYEAHAICLDVVLPILDELTLSGEVWTGEALDGYRAGVWQSISIADGNLKTIRAHGAWVQLDWRPAPRWQVVAGVGFDDPKDSDFQGKDGRYRNDTLFANVRYRIWKKAAVGLELDRMSTDYRDDDDRTDYRVQISFLLPF